MREVEGQGGAREARDAALVSSKRCLCVCVSVRNGGQPELAGPPTNRIPR